MVQNPILEVLHTPELIALILANLPIHDLLINAPLVSHTFHNVIISTPTLQESLFFRPSGSPTFVLNPFLKAAFPAHFQPSWAESWSSVSVPALQDLPWGRRPEIFKRREASWRRMLLWNGGGLEKMSKVKVVSCMQQMSGTDKQEGFLEVPEGLRMGMVWDLTKRACEGGKGQFALKWKIHVPEGEWSYVESVVVRGSAIAPDRSFWERMKGLLRRRRMPVETRYVELGNRVDYGSDDGDADVVGIWLSTYTSCEGRDILALPQKGFENELRSEAEEEVKVEYGDTVRIPDSVAFGNSVAALRRQASRVERVLAEAGFI